MTTLSPEAYEVLQKARAAYIKAGPEGMCRGRYYDPDGSRCFLGRVLEALDIHPLSAYKSPVFNEILIAGHHRTTRGGLSNISAVNDNQGFDEMVALADRMLVECAPAAERVGVLV